MGYAQSLVPMLSRYPTGLLTIGLAIERVLVTMSLDNLVGGPRKVLVHHNGGLTRILVSDVYLLRTTASSEALADSITSPANGSIDFFYFFYCTSNFF